MVDHIHCIPSSDTGIDMRDCCSPNSEVTCDVLSVLNFLLFFLSLMLFLQVLLKREALRHELLLFALHVSICLALLSRAIFFLNTYFYSEGRGEPKKGYCAYIVFSFAPITFLSMGAVLFASYIWYMSACTTEALGASDNSLAVKKKIYIRFAISFCSILLIIDIFFSAFKCVRGERLDFRFAYYHFGLYLFLVFYFLGSSMRLLQTLRKGYF